MRDKRTILNQIGHCEQISQTGMFHIQSLILEVLIDIRDCLRPIIVDNSKQNSTGNERPFPV